MTSSYRSNLPKYCRLAEELRAQIESGELPSGAQLPSVAQIRAQHGVSLTTIDKAHTLLEKDGLIVREQGRGTFVAQANAPRAAHRLGLVLHVDPTANLYSSELLVGVRQEATRQKLEMLWLTDEDVKNSDKVDAVLMYCDPAEALTLNLPMRLPRALLLQHSSDFNCVAADDFAGAKLAVRHLQKLGHRRIAYLLSSNIDTISRRRLAGYHAALEAAGLPYDENFVRPLRKQRPFSYRESGEMAMQSWLQEGWHELDCTAIMAHNDEAAIGVIKALASANLRVPEDVSVVGFDGTELSELSTPSLTTIKVPLREIGAAAVQILTQQMEQGVVPELEKTLLPVQLKIGASTAPVATRSEALVSLHN